MPPKVQLPSPQRVPTQDEGHLAGEKATKAGVMRDKPWRRKEKKGQEKEEKTTKDEREKAQGENSSNEYRSKNQRITTQRRRNIWW